MFESRAKSSSGEFDPLFNPKSIALIGASDRAGSVGQSLAKNLISFPGKLLFINKNRSSVLGIPCWRSLPQIEGLEKPIDLAIIATPAGTVPSLVRECADAGVKAAVVISAGFMEAGPCGRKLQQELLSEAKRSGIRILGPNCLGVISPHSGLNASFAAALPSPGSLAFISQSGALCTALLDWSLREGVGFSGFASLGAMADIGWSDVITHFANDPNTRSIVMYIESLGDVNGFMAAATEASQTKPLFAIKVGRTSQAAAAAATHTGSMTGDDEIIGAALEKAGVIRLNTAQEIFDIAALVSKVVIPAKQDLAIITNAGGPAALATDILVRAGGSLSTLADSTIVGLSKQLPEHWSHANPADILGDADASRYSQALQTVLDDPNTDGVLVILTPQHMTEPLKTAEALIGARKSTRKPIIASWMGGKTVTEARIALTSAGIPNYDCPDQAALAWRLLAAWKQRHPLLGETRVLINQTRDAMIPAREALLSYLTDAPLMLSEAQSKSVLTQAGIRSVETHIAHSEESAVSISMRLGFPVVLKLNSLTVTHKSEVGGVLLDLADVAAVSRAWTLIKSRVQECDFGGVTVQPMFNGPSIEVICGFRQDAQYGSVLIFGAGGTLTETLRDTIILLPPISPHLVIDRIKRTRIFGALGGTRHFKKIDIDALSNLLVQLGKLAMAAPEIEECDINPLVFQDGAPIALDARMKCGPRKARNITSFNHGT